MIKIFRYELMRLIINKFFISLLVINGLFAWYTLTTDIIAGAACTAPFSPWSFGAYLATVMPFSILTILFLLTFYYSKKETHVKVLTTATPVNQIKYTLVRSGAIAVCFLIICFLVVGLGLYFYITVFDYWDFRAFILPAIMILLPCFIFSIGIGHIAGRIHPGLLFMLMFIEIIVGFSGIGNSLDFFGNEFFRTYPLSLPVGADGEPQFTVAAGFWLARIIYLAAGVVLLLIGITPSKRNREKLNIYGQAW